MRKGLCDLIRKTIVFKYTLPNNTQNVNIPKISHSTLEDYCYENKYHDDIVNVIYNAIIEYSFSSQEISMYDYSALHVRALKSKLKYDHNAPDEIKLKYGFYGEILLDCLLKTFFQTKALIARGFFYNLLENSETKGFDCFHVVEENELIELWFGEAKFYKNFNDAIDSVMSKIDISLSDDYLNKNLIALCEEGPNFDCADKNIQDIIELWKNNPDMFLPSVLKEGKFKLVYPILLVFDNKNNSYDEVISSVVNYLNCKYHQKQYKLSIPYEIFFILLPLSDSLKIKKDVIQWISEKRQLI